MLDWRNHLVWRYTYRLLWGCKHLQGYVEELWTDHHPVKTLFWVDHFTVSTAGAVYDYLFCFNAIHKQNDFKAFCFYSLQGHFYFTACSDQSLSLMLCSSWDCRLHTVIWNIMILFRKVSPILCYYLLVSWGPKKKKRTLTSLFISKRIAEVTPYQQDIK